MIDAYKKSMARTEPGRGALIPDDGEGPRVKTRSIPNVPTERLHRAVEFAHGRIHTAEGLHSFDDPRRSLLETGMKIRATTHELRLRGEKPGDCTHCWGE